MAVDTPATTLHPASDLTPRRERNRMRLGWQLVLRIRRDPVALSSVAILVVVMLGALFATSLEHPYDNQDLLHRNASPSRDHLVGTDQLGRDVLSRIEFVGSA